MSKTSSPRQGGSYIRRKDGTLERVAGTIGIGEPGHPEQASVARKPAAVAPAAPARRPSKRSKPKATPPGTPAADTPPSRPAEET